MRPGKHHSNPFSPQIDSLSRASTSDFPKLKTLATDPNSSSGGGSSDKNNSGAPLHNHFGQVNHFVRESSHLDGKKFPRTSTAASGAAGTGNHTASPVPSSFNNEGALDSKGDNGTTNSTTTLPVATEGSSTSSSSFYYDDDEGGGGGGGGRFSSANETYTNTDSNITMNNPLATITEAVLKLHQQEERQRKEHASLLLGKRGGDGERSSTSPIADGGKEKAEAGSLSATGAAAPDSSPSPRETPRTAMKTIVFSQIGFGIDHQAFSSSGIASLIMGRTQNATEAAVRAVRDAIERCCPALFLSAFARGGGNRLIHVKLGVPPKKSSSTVTNTGGDGKGQELMDIDCARVASVLPRDFHVLPIETVVGGLAAFSGNEDNNDSERDNICCVVACVTIGSDKTTSDNSTTTAAADNSNGHKVNAESELLLRRELSRRDETLRNLRNAAESQAWTMRAKIANLENKLQQHARDRIYYEGQLDNLRQRIVIRDESITILAKNADNLRRRLNELTCSAGVGLGVSLSSNGAGPPIAAPPPALPPMTLTGSLPQSVTPPVINSVSVSRLSALASEQRSAALANQHKGGGHDKMSLLRRDRPPLPGAVGSPGRPPHSSPPSKDVKKGHGNNRDASISRPMTVPHRPAGMPGRPHHTQVANPNHAKTFTHRSSSDGKACEEDQDELHRKRPRSPLTAQKNKRRLVQHHYHDHSLDLPTEEEVAMIVSKPSGPAFPFKLHEMLDKIASEGFADIISWLPHGRCFKIHKNEEFCDVILPNFFVMTKKSSFLRQLNLYGFNRLSAGPDKGAYYHELFLKGRRFLCRRMVRQKVNGNGIRQAGNPDMEPNFHSMPPVLPMESLNASGSGLNGHTEEVMSCEQEHGDSHDYDNEEAEETYEEDEETSYYDDEEERGSHINKFAVTFPLRLHVMLDQLEAEGNTDIVSWLAHGRCFMVHDHERFVKEIMPMFFRQSKYSSFQRQLHLYGFRRITAGKDKGAYFHDSFLRGMPHLCRNMVRTKVNGHGTRKPGDPETEPDFYVMSPIPPIPLGTKVVGIPHTDDDDEDEDDEDSGDDEAVAPTPETVLSFAGHSSGDRNAGSLGSTPKQNSNTDSPLPLAHERSVSDKA